VWAFKEVDVVTVLSPAGVEQSVHSTNRWRGSRHDGQGALDVDVVCQSVPFSTPRKTPPHIADSSTVQMAFQGRWLVTPRACCCPWGKTFGRQQPFARWFVPVYHEPYTYRFDTDPIASGHFQMTLLSRPHAFTQVMKGRIPNSTTEK
jgi:hypothetical protein